MKNFFFLCFASVAFAAQYDPTYLVRRGGDFGGLQSDYIQRAQAMIAQTEETIRDGVENQRDLKDLFFTLLDMMGRERRQIAADHQTEAAEKFGLRRGLSNMACASSTNFSHPKYRGYKRPILDRLESFLSQMKHDDKQFIEKKEYVKAQALGRLSSIEIEILEAEDMQTERWFSTPLDERMPRWFPSKLCKPVPHSPQEEAKLLTAMSRLWKENPIQSQWLLRGYYIHTFWQFFPTYDQRKIAQTPSEWIEHLIMRKSVLVEAKVFLEINGKMQMLYGYLTCLHRDLAHPKQNTLSKMLHKANLLVLHQPQFFVEETLKDLAAVFEQIICWDRNDLTELKQQMALFRYEMACMPFYRGSAAISEWFEAALYGYHRVEYQCDKNRLTDLEIYSNPLFPDFLLAYTSMYTLSRK
jgi:hypothetical protein